MPHSSPINRVIWIVLDGVGVGELPDASKYGDAGSDTLGNLSRKVAKQSLHLPNLQKLGLGNLTPIQGVPALKSQEGIGAYGKALEQSNGKDTTTGHWEMAGLVTKKAFATFPKGFPAEIVDRWVRENKLPGVLGNCTASGTTIIDELGPEHLRTGKPILYTSADSVWQVAASEEAFGLERLYEICKSARKIGDELQIGRVIARPFIGNPAEGRPFQRTYNRKDLAQLPPSPTFLDHLVANKIPTLGIGKISNIYAGQGIDENWDSAGNEDGMRLLEKAILERKTGLIFCNLIDFDMLYGHRRDVAGYAASLEKFDQQLGALIQSLRPTDLLLLASDHGNDPTYPGTDHTREYIPVLAYTPSHATGGAVALGIRHSFADVGATAVEALVGPSGMPTGTIGQSFFSALNSGLAH